MFVLFENKVSYEDFFAHNSFKSCHRYILCITFIVYSVSDFILASTHTYIYIYIYNRYVDIYIYI